LFPGSLSRCSRRNPEKPNPIAPKNFADTSNRAEPALTAKVRKMTVWDIKKKATTLHRTIAGRRGHGLRIQPTSSCQATNCRALQKRKTKSPSKAELISRRI
jgi:hypothetical protein